MHTAIHEPYLLTVLTGPNAGAQIALAGGCTSIGGALSSGVILDGLPDTVLDLSITRDRARVRIAADGIDIRGIGPCRAGSASVMPLPIVLTLNDATQIHVCRAAPATPSRPRRRGGLGRLAALVAVIGLGGTGVAYTRTLSEFPGVRHMAALGPAALSDAAPASTAAPVATAAPVPRADPAVTVDAARTALASAIAAEGLDDLILTSDSETVRVSGRHAPAETAAWIRIRREYDVAWGARVPLILGDLVVEDAVPPIAIASALLGEPREIVTRDGATYRIGDTTNAGWQVTLIEFDRVGLSKGDTAVEIEF